MFTQLSFRGAGAAREPGIQKCETLLWIPGSLASLGFRNDGKNKTP